MSQKSQKTQPTTSPRNVMAVMIIGAILVVALLGWALTRTVKREVPSAAAPPGAATAPQPAAAAQSGEVAAVPRISQADLKTQFDAKSVTIIDVRDIDSYMAEHIPGALHIPLGRVEGEIPYLPKGKPIVTYCTCPNEESSGEAALILEHGGVPGAKALHGGMQEWRRLGYPLASGSKT